MAAHSMNQHQTELNTEEPTANTAASDRLRAEDGQSLRTVRSAGFPLEDIQEWEQFSIDLPVPLADAVRHMEPVFVTWLTDLHQRYPLLAGKVFHKPYSSLVVLPLLVGTRVLGAVWF